MVELCSPKSYVTCVGNNANNFISCREMYHETNDSNLDSIVWVYCDRLCFVDPNKTINLPVGLACVELALVMGAEVWFISRELSAKSALVR